MEVKSGNSLTLLFQKEFPCVLVMASIETTQGQENVECDLCHEPVSFFCRRCGVKLCDSCALIHLRAKTKFGHEVVEYASKDDVDTCVCESHPKHECSAYCETCDISICPLCVSVKHKSHEMSDLHEKIEELLKGIAIENDRLQSFRHELEGTLDHMTKQLSSLSSLYQKGKNEITNRGEMWHTLIDNHVKKLHQELDDLKRENEALLQKQKREFERIIGKIDEMNGKFTQLQRSKNVTEMQKFKPVIQERKIVKEIVQYMFPAFHDCKIDENHMQTYFGYIEKNPEMIMSQFDQNFMSGAVAVRKVLEVPTVTTVIETGFFADTNFAFFDMAVTDDKKVWMGGASNELKLYDLQGNLHRTVTISYTGMYICMYNKQVLFIDRNDNTVKTISDDDTVVTMFTTGEWEPKGITGSSSNDLLVLLRKNKQSKVVRYSSTGTVLQEIQYDSQCQPLYQKAWYIAENVNGDIIVTDHKKKIVVAVDRQGIFRYSYSGNEISFKPVGIATDLIGHVFVTDFNGNKIHMLDSDGHFLRNLIPKEGIECPRAVCMISDSEMIVGECLTALAKKIKFIEDLI